MQSGHAPHSGAKTVPKTRSLPHLEPFLRRFSDRCLIRLTAEARYPITSVLAPPCRFPLGHVSAQHHRHLSLVRCLHPPIRPQRDPRGDAQSQTALYASNSRAPPSPCPAGTSAYTYQLSISLSSKGRHGSSHKIRKELETSKAGSQAGIKW